MTTYALVDVRPAEPMVTRYQEFEEPPPPLAAAKGLRWLPVVEIKPAPEAHKVLEGPAIVVTASAVEQVWTARSLAADDVAASLAQARADKVADINAERDRRLRLGAPFGGKRFAMDDGSRTDLGGMATTAALVLAGALPWPESYVIGWIAMDNKRLPLPAAVDGIALAATVAGTYSAIVQHARTRKDLALTSTDPAAVDPLTGWPE
jgi:hypothetical protein